MPFRLRALVVLTAGCGLLAACAPPPTRVAASPPQRAAAPAPVAERAPEPAPAPAAPVAVAAAAPAPDAFISTVRPILLRHCVPCHEPGGQMYARMPFDNPETLRSHREGVLRRLKVPEEHAAVEAWLGGGVAPL